MANIRELLNNIKYAILGKEVRQSIHDAIEKCYNTASIDHDNANMEVKFARGTYTTLNDRFDVVEENIMENTAHIGHKAEQTDLEVQKERINNLIANNNQTDGNSELVDIRVGGSGKIYSSAGEAIRAISSGRELKQKVFSSCFVEDVPSYNINEGKTVINLKDYIVDIEIEGADESLVATVGRVTKNMAGLNVIGVYKCNSYGVPDGTEGLIFPISADTNDKQVIKAKGILNGIQVIGRMVIKNWTNLPDQDSKGLTYRVGGIANKCFIKTRFDLVTNDDIKSLTDRTNVLENKNNFNNSDFLEDLIEDIELIGFDTSMKMCLAMVRKEYTHGGTRPVANVIGIYPSLENGEADPSRGIIIGILPEEANETIKKHIRLEFEGREVEVKMTIHWWKITESEFNKQGISNFSVSGISFKNYTQKYNGLLSKESNFNNCSFLEELIENIELIGFDKRDKIMLSMVRRNFTKYGTTKPQNRIGLYKIDPDTGQANPSKYLFIELPEEINNDAPLTKHIKTKFDGDDVEVKITINWFKLKNRNELDANSIYKLSRFDIAGVKFKNYTEKLDLTSKNSYLTLNKSYTERPIITFIDDDGSKLFLTKSKPIFDKHGIKCSLGIVSKNATNGSSGNLQVDELKELQIEGYDILSHSHTHDHKLYKPGYVTENDEAIEADIRSSYEFIKNNGFRTNAIVYPWGEYPDKNKYVTLAQKYFNYGINAGAGGSNSVVMTDNVFDSMYYRRKFINDSPAIDSYKSLIDEALSTNGWLIFGMHSGINGEFSSERLDEIITYIKEKGIEILTFSEANKIKQNICSIGTFGEKGKSLYIGRTGVILN